MVQFQFSLLISCRTHEGEKKKVAYKLLLPARWRKPVAITIQVFLENMESEKDWLVTRWNQLDFSIPFYTLVQKKALKNFSSIIQPIGWILELFYRFRAQADQWREGKAKFSG